MAKRGLDRHRSPQVGLGAGEIKVKDASSPTGGTLQVENLDFAGKIVGTCKRSPPKERVSSGTETFLNGISLLLLLLRDKGSGSFSLCIALEFFSFK